MRGRPVLPAWRSPARTRRRPIRRASLLSGEYSRLFARRSVLSRQGPLLHQHQKSQRRNHDRQRAARIDGSRSGGAAAERSRSRPTKAQRERAAPAISHQQVGILRTRRQRNVRDGGGCVSLCCREEIGEGCRRSGTGGRRENTSQKPKTHISCGVGRKGSRVCARGRHRKGARGIRIGTEVRREGCGHRWGKGNGEWVLSGDGRRVSGRNRLAQDWIHQQKRQE